MKAINRIADILNKNLALLSVMIAVVALTLPAPFVNLSKIAIDLSWIPFLGSHFSSLGMVNLLLGIIMFGMGMTLSTQDFLLIIKRPRDVFAGILSQYACMAGFGWLCAELLQLTGIGGPQICAEIAVGLVLLGCVPGGTASNVMTFLARGDVALSVTLTMCTTLLAPFLTPSLTLALAGQWIEVDFWNMFFSIVMVVLLPILLGLAVHTILGDLVERFKKGLVFTSTICILLVVAMCVAPNQSRFLENGILLVIVTSLAVLLHHILGLMAGYLIGRTLRMEEAKVRALSLEVGLQNSGLSCTLANTASPNTMAILPCALATVIHQVVGPIVANFFASRDPSKASIPASQHLKAQTELG